MRTVLAHAWWARTGIRARFGSQPDEENGSGPGAVLLAWQFPPVVWGGTYRPLALARYARSSGWDLLVVGSEPKEPAGPAGRYLLEMVPPTVRVVRVPTVPQRPRPLLFPRINYTFLEALATFDTARQAVGRRRYDVVVASGPPFHVFAGGYYLAKALRSRFVLDYRDEWTENKVGFLALGGSDRTWEKRCLRAADAVIFVTESQLEHYVRAFPELDRHKCVVVHNGWEPADDAVHATEEAGGPDPDPNLLILSFIGFTARFTRIDLFLSTLDSVLRSRPELTETLRLRIVGRRDPKSDEDLESFSHREVLEIHDQVTKRDAMALMRSSTALVVLNPPTFERCLPTKLFDYIAARRPVLVFGDGGETAELVRRLDAGVVVPSDDPDALAQVLDYLIRGEVTCSSPGTRDAWLAQHTREQMAKDFFQVLDQVAEQRERGFAALAGRQSGLLDNEVR